MKMLDTQAFTRTPEGADIGLRICGPVPRMVAALIDFGVLLLGGFLIALVVTSAYSYSSIGFLLIGWFLLFWLFPAFCEIRWGGTLGKRLCGLHVINDDGTPINFSSALARNLLRFMDTMLVGILLPDNFLESFEFGDARFNIIWAIGMLYVQPSSLLCILFHPLHKRPGDMVAGTLVVRNDKSIAPQLSDKVEPADPPVPLTAAEQQAIIDFAGRRHTLSDARQAELASVLEQLTGQQGMPAVEVLLAYARSFTGATSQPEADDEAI